MATVCAHCEGVVSPKARACVHCGNPLSLPGKGGGALRLVSALWFLIALFGSLAASREWGGGSALVLSFLAWTGLLVAFYVTRDIGSRPIHGATKEID